MSYVLKSEDGKYYHDKGSFWKNVNDDGIHCLTDDINRATILLRKPTGSNRALGTGIEFELVKIKIEEAS